MPPLAEPPESTPSPIRTTTTTMEPPATRIHRSFGHLYRFRIQPASLPFALAVVSGYRSTRDAGFQDGLSLLLQQDLIGYLPGSGGTLCLTEKGAARLPQGQWERPCTLEETEKELLVHIVVPLVRQSKLPVTQDDVELFWRPLRDGRFHRFSKLVDPLLRQAKDTESSLVLYRGLQRVLQKMVDTGLATARHYTFDDTETTVQLVHDKDSGEYEKQRQIRVLPETSALFVRLCDCAFPSGRPEGKLLAIPTQPKPCQDEDCKGYQSTGGCWIVGTEHLRGCQ